jgi:dihydroorotase (multifunctional complex type)
MVDVSRAGVPLLIHAEDLGASELMGMRPPICESVAIARALELARQLKARVHICHLTSKEGLQVLKAFRSLGSKATAETAPHYLGLTKEEIERRGPYAKVEPPLRTREDNEALLSGLRREIDLIASDHAPHPKEEKDRMDLAPPGTTGVETTLPFLLDLSDKGALSLHDIVRLLCTGPAKLLGLSPRKGSLAIGSDADITIIDPKKKFDVCPQNLLTRTHDSIFLGRSFQGSPVATFSRGELIIENGEVMAKPGRGRFLSSQRARA